MDENNNSFGGEILDWMIWICFICIMLYSSYPSKVKKLESKVKKLERNKKGENKMSKLINSLIGSNCKIRSEEGLIFNGNVEINCLVLDADDEWMKISHSDKKGNTKIRILRIESISNIELIEE